MTNPSFTDPLIVSAIGYAMMGSINFVFGLHFLTRKEPLLVRGHYSLILGLPLTMLIIGVGFLSFLVTPLASLSYFVALMLIAIILTLLLSRLSNHLTLIGVKNV
ncbi:MAG: hypothetical protein RIF33_25815 [Cyclobacteriaceae bacterium]